MTCAEGEGHVPHPHALVSEEILQNLGPSSVCAHNGLPLVICYYTWVGFDPINEGGVHLQFWERPPHTISVQDW